jgi:lysozyme
MKTWLEIATPIIMKWEGFRAAPYLCSAGKWTIGYGTIKYPNGVKVKQTDKPITPAIAASYLEASAKRVYQSLLPLVHQACQQHEWAALDILAYNVGVGTHDGKKGDLADSTLLAKLNRGDRAGAADQFLVWNKIHDKNGKVVALDGLTTRRKEERLIFLGKV